MEMNKGNYGTQRLDLTKNMLELTIIELIELYTTDVYTYTRQ